MTDIETLENWQRKSKYRENRLWLKDEGKRKEKKRRWRKVLRERVSDSNSTKREKVRRETVRAGLWRSRSRKGKKKMTEVILHIYDVTNSGSEKTNNTILHINKIFKDGIGLGGIFHSAVQVSLPLFLYLLTGRYMNVCFGPSVHCILI